MNLVVYLELIGGFEGAGICPLNKDKTFKKIDIAKAVEGSIEADHISKVVIEGMEGNAGISSSPLSRHSETNNIVFNFGY